MKPYKGSEPYIFISYAHRDFDQVEGIIRRLSEQHYRIWYDEGIDPGTEWDENIASHVLGCHFFIAMLSSSYLQSENCKDELNFARDNHKKRILVFLEDVSMPPGMAMRLNRLQSIYKCRYDNQDEFYEKLYSAPGIEACLNEKQDIKEKSDPEKIEPNKKTEKEPAEKTKKTQAGTRKKQTKPKTAERKTPDELLLERLKRQETYISKEELELLEMEIRKLRTWRERDGEIS